MCSVTILIYKLFWYHVYSVLILNFWLANLKTILWNLLKSLKNLLRFLISGAHVDARFVDDDIRTGNYSKHNWPHSNCGKRKIYKSIVLHGPRFIGITCIMGLHVHGCQIYFFFYLLIIYLFFVFVSIFTF